ncbi:MOSC domain-containing protein [Thalassobius sp. MITS945101]|uniref:MOSC domain-containing protein n=1 Tax=Thalassobius sp. MITS945101 TaxID=3096994 RepID=UPI00399B6A81
MSVTVATLWRHPIKGIGAEPLSKVRLSRGGPVPLDRAYAVLTGTAEHTGAWQKCRNFARGCFGPELMAVTARTEGDQITLSHPKLADLTVNPDLDGVKVVEWITPIYPEARPAPHTLIKAPAGGMADADFSAVAILSNSSLADLGQTLGAELDQRRFRGNLWLDGLAPWAELDLVGRELQIGAVRLKVIDRIERCRATETNPDTGARDQNTLKAIREIQGHTDFGIRAEVLNDGEIALGDRLEVL